MVNDGRSLSVKPLIWTFESYKEAQARNEPTPIAQMADIGFKVVLLERLNQKWKQKHF